LTLQRQRRSRAKVLLNARRWNGEIALQVSFRGLFHWATGRHTHRIVSRRMPARPHRGLRPPVWSMRKRSPMGKHTSLLPRHRTSAACCAPLAADARGSARRRPTLAVAPNCSRNLVFATRLADVPQVDHTRSKVS
jgi:hypothetical protein